MFVRRTFCCPLARVHMWIIQKHVSKHNWSVCTINLKCMGNWFRRLSTNGPCLGDQFMSFLPYSYNIGIVRTTDFGDGLLIGIVRTIDRGDTRFIIIGIVRTIDVRDYRLIAIVETTAFGCCLLLGIVLTAGPGGCLLMQFARVIEFRACLLNWIVDRNNRQLGTY